MSGVGKSHLSHALAERGWGWHDCDTEIAARLGALVSAAPGEAPVHALGRWMGMPWSDGYGDRERRYLELEEEVTRAALEAARAGDGPQVIDTTGSVIYLSEGLREALRDACDVVYLRTPSEDHARMLELYLREPKPVVWGGLYTATGPEALPTAYPALLAERERRYLALAHRWVWATALRGLTIAESLRLIGC